MKRVAEVQCEARIGQATAKMQSGIKVSKPFSIMSLRNFFSFIVKPSRPHLSADFHSNYNSKYQPKKNIIYKNTILKNLVYCVSLNNLKIIFIENSILLNVILSLFYVLYLKEELIFFYIGSTSRRRKNEG